MNPTCPSNPYLSNFNATISKSETFTASADIVSTNLEFTTGQEFKFNFEMPSMNEEEMQR